MKNVDRRLGELERQQSAIELDESIRSMTDEELEALINEDPAAGSVLRRMTNAELEALASGDKAAERLFEKRCGDARRVHEKRI